MVGSIDWRVQDHLSQRNSVFARIACPVDCEMTDWGGWTPCTPYCNGKQQRTVSELASLLGATLKFWHAATALQQR